MQLLASPRITPTASVFTSAQSSDSEAPIAPAGFSNELKGRKILIVDDDRLNIHILTGILKGEGFKLADADSAERAFEVYAEFKPDLVLFDVMLPGIDGFTACRRLRQQYGEDAAPVIFITAKQESDDVVEGLSAGGVDYLPKPFRRKEAIARIRTHLHNRLLIEQQRSLVEQLSKANTAKNKLLGMAAHDLRNPLASIRGLSEFLRDGTVGPISADQLDLVNTIFDTSQSMLTLLNELLDVATIEAGDLQVHCEHHNLAELLEKSVYLNNINAARKNTRIVCSVPDEPAVAWIDFSKMKQVVDNLLSNAVKYSPPGSTVRTTLTTTPAGYTIAVQDEGPGIPDNERHKLFKDFTTLSVKPTGGEKATGLGLAICRKIVEAHSGAIAAANLRTGGCEFSVTLPFLPKS